MILLFLTELKNAKQTLVRIGFSNYFIDRPIRLFIHDVKNNNTNLNVFGKQYIPITLDL